MYTASQLAIGRKDLNQGSIMLQTLVNAAEAGQPLSLAEEDFTCSFLAASRSEGDNSFFDLHEINYCKNYSFTGCYLAYENNLSGLLIARNAFGPIPPNIVAKDVAFLDSQYQEWLQVINTTNHSEQLLQHVVKESRNHLKNARNFANNTRMGARLRDSFIKAIVLHSKYLYLKIREYYQELGATEQVLHRCNYEIVIDSFAFFHILFRHYAPRATSYQNDASYHQDQTINPEELPNHLMLFLEMYFNHIPCTQFNKRRTYIRYNGVIYAIWFKDAERHAGGTVQPILRLQTFYPVTLPKELEYVASLQENVTESGLGLFHAPVS
ncbi:hypothetical protein GCM10027594_05090 [Hymenobacter agri]